MFDNLKIIKILNSLKKNICYILVVVYFFTSTNIEQCFANPVQNPMLLQANPIVKTGILLATETARITQMFDKNSQKTIILIKDLHCNKEVQQNTYKILEAIKDRYKQNFKNIYVEGAWSRLDFQDLNSLEIEHNLKEKLIDKWIEQGIITGAEKFGIANPNVQLIGIEDRQTYLQNFKQLMDAYKTKNEANFFIELALSKIQNYKSKLYFGVLKNIQQTITDYKNQKITMTEYLHRLNDYSIHFNVDFKNRAAELYKLYLCSQIIKKIGNKRFILEEANILETRIIDFLTKQEYEKLWQLKRAGTTDYYFYLQRMAITKNISFANLSALNIYFEYLNLYSSINTSMLLVDEKHLLNEILLGASTTQKQRDIIEIEYLLETYHRFLNNSAIAMEVMDIMVNGEVYIKKIKDYLNANASDLLWMNGLQESFEPFKKTFDLMRDFYVYADQRNFIFADNIEKNRTDDSVIVAFLGGFHSDAVADIFRKKNYNVMVISPNITEEADNNLYKNLLFEQAKILNLAFGDRLALVSHFQTDGMTAEEVKRRAIFLNGLAPTGVDVDKLQAEDLLEKDFFRVVFEKAVETAKLSDEERQDFFDEMAKMLPEFTELRRELSIKQVPIIEAGLRSETSDISKLTKEEVGKILRDIKGKKEEIEKKLKETKQEQEELIKAIAALEKEIKRQKAEIAKKEQEKKAESEEEKKKLDEEIEQLKKSIEQDQENLKKAKEDKEAKDKEVKNLEENNEKLKPIADEADKLLEALKDFEKLSEFEGIKVKLQIKILQARDEEKSEEEIQELIIQLREVEWFLANKKLDDAEDRKKELEKVNVEIARQRFEQEKKKLEQIQQDKKIKNLEQERNNLNKAIENIETFEKEKEELEKAIFGIKDKISELEIQKRRKEREKKKKEKKKEDVAGLTADIAKIEADLKTKKAEFDRKKKALQEKRRELSDARAEKKSNEQKLKYKEAELKKQKTEKSKLVMQENETGKYIQDLTRLAKEMEFLLNSENLRKRAEDLRAEIIALRAEQKKQEEEVKKQEDELERLTHEKEIERREEEIKELRKEKEIATLNEEIRKLEEELVKNIGELVGLQADIKKAVGTKKAELENKKIELEKTIKEKEEKIEGNKKKLKSLEELLKKEDVIKDIKAKEDALQALKESAVKEDDVKDKKDALKKSNEDLEEQTKQLKKSEDEFKKLTATFAYSLLGKKTYLDSEIDLAIEWFKGLEDPLYLTAYKRVLEYELVEKKAVLSDEELAVILDFLRENKQTYPEQFKSALMEKLRQDKKYRIMEEDFRFFASLEMTKFKMTEDENAMLLESFIAEFEERYKDETQEYKELDEFDKEKLSFIKGKNLDKYKEIVVKRLNQKFYNAEKKRKLDELDMADIEMFKIPAFAGMTASIKNELTELLTKLEDLKALSKDDEKRLEFLQKNKDIWDVENKKILAKIKFYQLLLKYQKADVVFNEEDLETEGILDMANEFYSRLRDFDRLPNESKIYDFAVAVKLLKEQKIDAKSVRYMRKFLRDNENNPRATVIVKEALKDRKETIKTLATTKIQSVFRGFRVRKGELLKEVIEKIKKGREQRLLEKNEQLVAQKQAAELKQEKIQQELKKLEENKKVLERNIQRLRRGIALWGNLSIELPEIDQARIDTYYFSTSLYLGFPLQGTKILPLEAAKDQGVDAYYLSVLSLKEDELTSNIESIKIFILEEILRGNTTKLAGSLKDLFNFVFQSMGGEEAGMFKLQVNLAESARYKQQNRVSPELRVSSLPASPVGTPISFSPVLTPRSIGGTSRVSSPVISEPVDVDTIIARSKIYSYVKAIEQESPLKDTHGNTFLRRMNHLRVDASLSSEELDDLVKLAISGGISRIIDAGKRKEIKNKLKAICEQYPQYPLARLFVDYINAGLNVIGGRQKAILERAFGQLYGSINLEDLTSPEISDEISPNVNLYLILQEFANKWGTTEQEKIERFLEDRFSNTENRKKFVFKMYDLMLEEVKGKISEQYRETAVSAQEIWDQLALAGVNDETKLRVLISFMAQSTRDSYQNKPFLLQRGDQLTWLSEYWQAYEGRGDPCVISARTGAGKTRTMQYFSNALSGVIQQIPFTLHIASFSQKEAGWLELVRSKTGTGEGQITLAELAKAQNVDVWCKSSDISDLIISKISDLPVVIKSGVIIADEYDTYIEDLASLVRLGLNKQIHLSATANPVQLASEGKTEQLRELQQLMEDRKKRVVATMEKYILEDNISKQIIRNKRVLLLYPDDKRAGEDIVKEVEGYFEEKSDDVKKTILYRAENGELWAHLCGEDRAIPFRLLYDQQYQEYREGFVVCLYTSDSVGGDFEEFSREEVIFQYIVYNKTPTNTEYAQHIGRKRADVGEGEDGKRDGLLVSPVIVFMNEEMAKSAFEAKVEEFSIKKQNFDYAKVLEAQIITKKRQQYRKLVEEFYASQNRILPGRLEDWRELALSRINEVGVEIEAQELFNALKLKAKIKDERSGQIQDGTRADDWLNLKSRVWGTTDRTFDYSPRDNFSKLAGAKLKDALSRGAKGYEISPSISSKMMAIMKQELGIDLTKKSLSDLNSTEQKKVYEFIQKRETTLRRIEEEQKEKEKILKQVRAFNDGVETFSFRVDMGEIEALEKKKKECEGKIGDYKPVEKKLKSKVIRAWEEIIPRTIEAVDPVRVLLNLGEILQREDREEQRKLKEEVLQELGIRMGDLEKRKSEIEAEIKKRNSDLEKIEEDSVKLAETAKPETKSEEELFKALKTKPMEEWTEEDFHILLAVLGTINVEEIEKFLVDSERRRMQKAEDITKSKEVDIKTDGALSALIERYLTVIVARVNEDLNNLPKQPYKKNNQLQKYLKQLEDVESQIEDFARKLYGEATAEYNAVMARFWTTSSEIRKKIAAKADVENKFAPLLYKSKWYDKLLKFFIVLSVIIGVVLVAHTIIGIAFLSPALVLGLTIGLLTVATIGYVYNIVKILKRKRTGGFYSSFALILNIVFLFFVFVLIAHLFLPISILAIEVSHIVLLVLKLFLLGFILYKEINYSQTQKNIARRLEHIGIISRKPQFLNQKYIEVILEQNGYRLCNLEQLKNISQQNRALIIDVFGENSYMALLLDYDVQKSLLDITYKKDDVELKAKRDRFLKLAKMSLPEYQQEEVSGYMHISSYRRSAVLERIYKLKLQVKFMPEKALAKPVEETKAKEESQTISEEISKPTIPFFSQDDLVALEFLEGLKNPNYTRLILRVKAVRIIQKFQDEPFSTISSYEEQFLRDIEKEYIENGTFKEEDKLDLTLEKQAYLEITSRQVVDKFFEPDMRLAQKYSDPNEMHWAIRTALFVLFPIYLVWKFGERLWGFIKKRTDWGSWALGFLEWSLGETEKKGVWGIISFVIKSIFCLTIALVVWIAQVLWNIFILVLSSIPAILLALWDTLKFLGNSIYLFFAGVIASVALYFASKKDAKIQEKTQDLEYDILTTEKNEDVVHLETARDIVIARRIDERLKKKQPLTDDEKKKLSILKQSKLFYAKQVYDRYLRTLIGDELEKHLVEMDEGRSFEETSEEHQKMYRQISEERLAKYSEFMENRSQILSSRKQEITDDNGNITHIRLFLPEIDKPMERISPVLEYKIEDWDEENECPIENEDVYGILYKIEIDYDGKEKLVEIGKMQIYYLRDEDGLIVKGLDGKPIIIRQMNYDKNGNLKNVEVFENRRIVFKNKDWGADEKNDSPKEEVEGIIYARNGEERGTVSFIYAKEEDGTIKRDEYGQPIFEKITILEDGERREETNRGYFSSYIARYLLTGVGFKDIYRTREKVDIKILNERVRAIENKKEILATQNLKKDDLSLTDEQFRKLQEWGIISKQGTISDNFTDFNAEQKKAAWATEDLKVELLENREKTMQRALLKTYLERNVQRLDKKMKLNEENLEFMQNLYELCYEQGFTDLMKRVYEKFGLKVLRNKKFAEKHEAFVKQFLEYYLVTYAKVADSINISDKDFRLVFEKAKNMGLANNFENIKAKAEEDLKKTRIKGKLSRKLDLRMSAVGLKYKYDVKKVSYQNVLLNGRKHWRNEKLGWKVLYAIFGLIALAFMIFMIFFSFGFVVVENYLILCVLAIVLFAIVAISGLIIYQARDSLKEEEWQEKEKDSLPNYFKRNILDKILVFTLMLVLIAFCWWITWLVFSILALTTFAAILASMSWLFFGVAGVVSLFMILVFLQRYFLKPEVLVLVGDTKKKRDSQFQSQSFLKQRLAILESLTPKPAPVIVPAVVTDPASAVASLGGISLEALREIQTKGLGTIEIKDSEIVSQLQENLPKQPSEETRIQVINTEEYATGLIKFEAVWYLTKRDLKIIKALQEITNGRYLEALLQHETGESRILKGILKQNPSLSVEEALEQAHGRIVLELGEDTQKTYELLYGYINRIIEIENILKTGGALNLADAQEIMRNLMTSDISLEELYKTDSLIKELLKKRSFEASLRGGEILIETEALEFDEIVKKLPANVEGTTIIIRGNIADIEKEADNMKGLVESVRQRGGRLVFVMEEKVIQEHKEQLQELVRMEALSITGFFTMTNAIVLEPGKIIDKPIIERAKAIYGERMNDSNAAKLIDALIRQELKIRLGILPEQEEKIGILDILNRQSYNEEKMRELAVAVNLRQFVIAKPVIDGEIHAKFLVDVVNGLGVSTSIKELDTKGSDTVVRLQKDGDLEIQDGGQKFSIQPPILITMDDLSMAQKIALEVGVATGQFTKGISKMLGPILENIVLPFIARKRKEKGLRITESIDAETARNIKAIASAA